MEDKLKMLNIGHQRKMMFPVLSMFKLFDLTRLSYFIFDTQYNTYHWVQYLHERIVGTAHHLTHHNAPSTLACVLHSVWRVSPHSASLCQLCSLKKSHKMPPWCKINIHNSSINLPYGLEVGLENHMPSYNRTDQLQI